MRRWTAPWTKSLNLVPNFTVLTTLLISDRGACDLWSVSLPSSFWSLLLCVQSSLTFIWGSSHPSSFAEMVFQEENWKKCDGKAWSKFLHIWKWNWMDNVGRTNHWSTRTAFSKGPNSKNYKKCGPYWTITTKQQQKTINAGGVIQRDRTRNPSWWGCWSAG